MHRPDHSTADPNGAGSGKAGYTSGNPLGLPPVPRTIVTHEHLNDLGESQCVLVEAADITLVKGDYDQVLEAVIKHAAREAERRSIMSLTRLALTAGTTYTLVGIAADGAGNVTSVGATGAGVCYAQDSADHGETWTQNALSATLDEIDDVAYGAGYFVAVGYDVGVGQIAIVHRTIAGAWSAIVSVVTAAQRPRAITYNGTHWVIVGDDGLVWQTSNTPPTSGWTSATANAGMVLDVNDVASDGTTTVAVGRGGPGTSDGRTTRTTDVTVPWTVVAVPQLESTNQALSVATDGAGRWVFGLEDGYVAATLDFSTWVRTRVGTTDIVGLAHAGQHFVMVNTAGEIATSPTGAVWSSPRDMAVTSLADVTAADLVYVAGAVSTNKVAMRSGYAL